jgi:hypothetical protein
MAVIVTLCATTTKKRWENKRQMIHAFVTRKTFFMPFHGILLLVFHPFSRLALSLSTIANNGVSVFYQRAERALKSILSGLMVDYE